MPELSTIRELLHSLPEYPLSVGTPLLFLSTADCLRCACIDSEQFHSRSAVKANAEEVVSKRYRQAQDYLSAYLDPSSPDSFCRVLQERLERRLSLLREQITDLRNDRNGAVVCRIQSLLSADAVMEQIEKSMSLASFALSEKSVYFAKIQYETFNPADYEEGLLKVIAILFCTYGYNAFDAIHDLETDAEKIVSNYHKTLSCTASHLIQTQIVIPIQNKLSLL